MSEILKEKGELVRERLKDVDLEPGDNIEVDLDTGHVVLTVFPLSTPLETYHQRMARALALAEENAERIKKEIKGQTDAVKAIHATREDRGKAITG